MVSWTSSPTAAMLSTTISQSHSRYYETVFWREFLNFKTPLYYVNIMFSVPCLSRLPNCCMSQGTSKMIKEKAQCWRPRGMDGTKRRRGREREIKTKYYVLFIFTCTLRCLYDLYSIFCFYSLLRQTRFTYNFSVCAKGRTKFSDDSRAIWTCIIIYKHTI